MGYTWRVSDSEPIDRCPACDAPLGPDDLDCPACGHRLARGPGFHPLGCLAILLALFLLLVLKGKDIFT